MAESTQANFDAIKDANAHAQGLDGGLNLKTDSSRLSPPATTRADNAWYLQPGNAQQLPAPASVMQANTSHVYNVHARDLPQPATTGDIMVHGEVRDAPASATNLFTSPVWSDGYGATLNTQQPCVPVTQRTRTLTGKTAIALPNYNDNFVSADQYNTLMARQEAGYSAAAPQRYALGYHNGTQLNLTFGLVDGLIETPETLTLSFNADYCEIAGVQGTNYWICAAISGLTLTVYTYDFKGVQVAAPITVSSQALQYNNVASGYYAPLSILQHAGRTFVAYINNPSGAADAVFLWDVIGKTTVQIGVGSSSSPNNGFAISSPYSHQAPSSTLFLTCLYNNNVFVVAQTSVLATGVVVGQTGALGIASSTGYTSSFASPVNFTATMTTCVFAGGGTGTAASLGVTVFRHYPELVTRASDSSQFWYQAVSADRISFQANATTATSTGTITSLGQNVFRTPMGVALAGKAFDLFPNAALGAGLPSAKSGYCLVRSGAVEPLGGYGSNSDPYAAWWTYAQPTYFVIDHQARVVGRAMENIAPCPSNLTLANNGLYRGSGNSTAAAGNAVQVTSLSSPLVLSLNNDLSVLDLVMPAWMQAYGNPALNKANVPYTPQNAILEIGSVIWSLSAHGASVPPIQGGPYTVLSGPLTCVHDGRGVIEANYHFGAHSPQPKVTTTSTNGAGAAGTYYWAVVYEWVDSLGRIHRSAPSTPMPGFVATGSFLASASVNVPLPISAKTAVGGVLNARLYRSVLNQTDRIFYLVSTQVISALSSSTYWATLSDPGYYIDATGSASGGAPALTTQPRLYANNINGLQTFPSNAPPAFIWQCAAKGRAFGIAQNSQTARLYYSSQIQDGLPFEWNVSNYAPIPTDIGDVRSIEALDDKIIFFGTRSIAYLNGDGPSGAYTTNTNVAVQNPTPNDGFSLIGPVPTPIGCIGTGAPARTPDGLLFQGYSGVQVLGRDLSIKAIGAAVDTFTGRQVGNPGVILGRGVTLASLQSVVFTCASSQALVYNYLTQRWSVWPLMAGATNFVQRLDGTVFATLQPIQSGQYAALANTSTAGSDVVQLGATYAPIYQGNQTAAALVLESPWILPSGESGGEAALWDCTVTGGYIGPHILQIEQSFNYVGTYQAPIQFKVPTAPYIYQYRVRPKQTARIWAARYRITILPLTTLGAQYFMASLGDLVLNYGSKQGTSRLSAAASG